MCLTVKHELIFTADRDIVCWKFLEVIEGNDKEEIYVTPYRFKPVPREVLEGKEDFTPFACEPFQKKPRNKAGYIEPVAETGYIHAHGLLSPEFLFGEFDDMCYWLGKKDTYIDWYESGIIGCDRHPMVTGVSLWRCVIPKGTKYWLGETDSKRPMFGYAAEEIRFEEEVFKIEAGVSRQKGEDYKDSVLYITLSECDEIIAREMTGDRSVEAIAEYHGLKLAPDATESTKVYWIAYKPKYPEPCA